MRSTPGADIWRTVSAPIINGLGFLDVHVGSASYHFGAWGYCQTSGGHSCTSSGLGYNLGSIIGQLSNESDLSKNTYTALTKANVLVPVACVLAFIAFLIALCSRKIGYLLASVMSVLAFVVSLVIMVVNFSTYGAAKNDVNGNNNNVSASYGAAMWILLAATILLLLASFTTLFECCCGRRRKQRDHDAAVTAAAVGTTGAAATAGSTSRWGRKRKNKAAVNDMSTVRSNDGLVTGTKDGYGHTNDELLHNDPALGDPALNTTTGGGHFWNKEKTTAVV